MKLTSVKEFMNEHYRVGLNETKKYQLKLKDNHTYLSYPQYLKSDINDKFGEDVIDDYDVKGNTIEITFGISNNTIIKKVKDELSKESLKEAKDEKPIKLKSFEKMIDDLGYDDVEELAYALEDKEFEKCGTYNCFVKKLNMLGMSLNDVEKILKKAIEH